MGEGANESQRESQLNEGIRRAHAWLGVIMLAVVVAFWLGYLAFTRELSQRSGIDIATLDRALWQYSKARQR